METGAVFFPGYFLSLNSNLPSATQLSSMRHSTFPLTGRHQRAGDTDEAVELQESLDRNLWKIKIKPARMPSEDGGRVSRLILGERGQRRG